MPSINDMGLKFDDLPGQPGDLCVIRDFFSRRQYDAVCLILERNAPGNICHFEYSYNDCFRVLFGGEIMFLEFQALYVRKLNITDVSIKRIPATSRLSNWPVTGKNILRGMYEIIQPVDQCL